MVFCNQTTQSNDFYGYFIRFLWIIIEQEIGRPLFSLINIAAEPGLSNSPPYKQALLERHFLAVFPALPLSHFPAEEGGGTRDASQTS